MASSLIRQAVMKVQKEMKKGPGVLQALKSALSAKNLPQTKVSKRK